MLLGRDINYGCFVCYITNLRVYKVKKRKMKIVWRWDDVLKLFRYVFVCVFIYSGASRWAIPAEIDRSICDKIEDIF